MQLSDKQKGYFLVALSGIFWGSGFLYIQYILDQGLASKDLVSWKMIIGFFSLLIITYHRDKDLLKIDRTGFIYFAVMALVCHVLYNLSMYTAISKTNIATTVSLMYTAPVFVLLIARFMYGERLTVMKVIVVLTCVFGVFLTATGGSFALLNLNPTGIFLGLFTGLCYAIMNVLSKRLLKTYKQMTILTYTFGIAFLLSLSFSNPLAAFQLGFNPWLWVNILLLGTVPTVLGYLCFTTGLSYQIESSKAAVIATIEVPVSVIGSYLIFGQDIFGWKLVGTALVLLSVILLEGNFAIRKRGLNNTSG